MGTLNPEMLLADYGAQLIYDTPGLRPKPAGSGRVAEILLKIKKRCSTQPQRRQATVFDHGKLPSQRDPSATALTLDQRAAVQCSRSQGIGKSPAQLGFSVGFGTALGGSDTMKMRGCKSDKEILLPMIHHDTLNPTPPMRLQRLRAL